MNITTPPPTEHARIRLELGESLHVLHPKSILAFQGPAVSREDRFMDLAGAYRKRKWIRSKLQGPCEFILGLPRGFFLETVDIPEQSELLFDLRHVMFFTDPMTMKSKILKWRNAWITRELVRMRFEGPGRVGLITVGGLATVQLDPVQPLFVDKSALVAYPESASIRLSVYGNPLASQHMNVQWELRGTGPVLMQTGSFDPELEDQLREDGFMKRMLREILPFGSVYIK